MDMIWKKNPYNLDVWGEILSASALKGSIALTKIMKQTMPPKSDYHQYTTWITAHKYFIFHVDNAMITVYLLGIISLVDNSNLSMETL